MAGNIVIDYRTSTKRLGSKTQHGKLVVCPKCKQRGAQSSAESFNECNGKVWPAEIRHFVTDGLGQPSESFCWLPLSEQGVTLRALKSFFEGLRLLVHDAVADELREKFPLYSERAHKPHGRGFGGGPACHGPLLSQSRLNVPVSVVVELLARPALSPQDVTDAREAIAAMRRAQSNNDEEKFYDAAMSLHDAVAEVLMKGVKS